MPPLKNGLQVVLQFPSEYAVPDPPIHPPIDDFVECHGFSNVPIDVPVLIVVDGASRSAQKVARRLGEDLARELRNTPPLTHACTPCHGIWEQGACHAFSNPECQKVLIVICDGATAPFTLPAPWNRSNPDHLVIPVVLQGTTAAALPPSLRAFNAVEWSPGDPNIAARLLVAAGIASHRPRMFISYVRKECDPLAEQLFEALHKERVEVFVDRFGLRPGADFQARLSEELSRMGTVLFLESKSIASRPWTRFEADFARAYRLGLLALHLKTGVNVIGVDPLDRRNVQLSPRRRLSRQALRDAVSWLLAAHARADHRRRTYLRDTLSAALALHGTTQQSFEARDVIVAQTKKHGRLAVRTSSLPAELVDFFVASQHLPAAAYAAVVAPGRFVHWRRFEPVGWLSKATKIDVFDEGDIDHFARSVS